MPDSTRTYVVRSGKASIPVAVRRADVKNLNLRVRADGTVVASVPRRTPWAAAEGFLDRRADWIARHVERVGAGAPEGPRTGAPALIPLWGGAEDTAARIGWTRPLDELERGEFERRLDALYRRETSRALEGLVRRWEELMGVTAASWTVRAMKTRWGSCTPGRRTVRINARLAAYPPECLEFVIAHELTHLMEPSHNTRFHALLDIYCPKNRELAAVLRRPAEEVAGIAGAAGPAGISSAQHESAGGPLGWGGGAAGPAQGAGDPAEPTGSGRPRRLDS